MTSSNEDQGVGQAPGPDELDHALIATEDVESAGRSCVVIIALAIVIVVLLAAWVLYTT